MSTAYGKTERVPFSRVAGASTLSVLLLLGQSGPLLANPTGGAVVAGSATIGAAGKTLTINQSTTSAIINWQTFSIASGETTKFIVPSSSASTLNYVLSGNPSQIYGNLSSNGQLFLINPAGILVGSTGRIDTAGFLGSTLNANNNQYLSGGNLQFSGDSTASVINQGSINASNGNVFLIANQVSNPGSITAPQGDVGLAAGSSVLLQQDGDQHLFVQSNPIGTTRAVGVSNAGTISAASAELRAAGGNAYALAINNTGSIAATGYKKINGQVYLTADTGVISNSGHITSHNGTNGGTVSVVSKTGTITDAGSIDASATAAKGTGGTVTLNSGTGLTAFSGAITAKGGTGGVGGNAEVSGQVLKFTGTVDLTAPGGKTGNLTLDPTTLDVITGGTGTITNDENDSTSTTIDPTTVDGVLATANLTLSAQSNITITNALAWSSGNTLTLTTTNTTGSSIVINASIIAASGGLAIDMAQASGQITTGGGGSVEVNSFELSGGSWVQNSSSLPLFSAPGNFELTGSASFLRVYGGTGSSTSPYLIGDIYGLEGLGSPSGAYLTSDANLAVSNLDATMTGAWNGGLGWTPIGSYTGNSSGSNTYSGVFNGEGNTINGLTIDSPNSEFAGLFGDTAQGAVVENLNLTNVNIVGEDYVGGLTGVSNAHVIDCTSSGTVTGYSYVGGLLGIIGGPVSGSSSSGTVIGDASSGDVGGLVGFAQFGSITTSSSTANVLTGQGNNTYDVGGLVGYNDVTITSSSASGTVTGQVSVGGLVGDNAGTISLSNSSANVTGEVGVGGLAGENSGVISQSYANGTVTGNTYIGGLAGENITGTITQSYAIASVTGGDDVGGLAGYNTAAIVNSFSTGTVTGTDDAIGGLIGYNSGSVVDSYTAGTVAAAFNTTEVGAVVGDNNGGTYTNVFWDTSSAGVAQAVGTGSVTGGIFGGTTTNLENSTFITSTGSSTPVWDFVNTWTTNGGTTLPQLVGVGGPGGTAGSGGSLDLLSGTAYTTSGGTTASDDVVIDLIFDGSLIGTGTTTSSGAFSFNVSSTDIGSGLLLTDATDKGDTYFQSSSSSTSFSGIDLYGSTLSVVSSSASNTALKTVIGSLSADGINYAVSGAALSTTSGVGMNIASGNYTVDGNITASGALNVGDTATLIGSANATLQGTSVTLNGSGINDTGALALHSTSGAITLEGVGDSDVPASVDGLTLTSTGAVNIQDSYITLPSGNFSASGTGYTSTTDANGEANGVNIFDTSLVLSGGNLTLTGTAGYTTTSGVLSSGLGVAVGSDGEEQTNLTTTGSGTITITGVANKSVNSKTYVAGVLVYSDDFDTNNTYVAVENGALAINGTATGISASGTGVNEATISGVSVESGAEVEATGDGSLAITGNTTGATANVTGSNFSYINGVEIGGVVGVNSGHLTITGTAGTVNTTNSTINSANEGSDGENNIPVSVGVVFDSESEGASDVTSGSGSTVTISGTGGAVVTTGAYTGNSVGVSFASNSSADFGTSVSNSQVNNGVENEDIVSNVSSLGSTVTVTGTGGSVNAGDGANSNEIGSTGVRIGGNLTVEDGGSLTVNGTGGALNAANATPVTGDNFPVTQGIRVNGGAVVAGLGSANLTFNGTGGTVTAGTNKTVGAVGVNIGDDDSTVTLSVQDGVLTINGTGLASPSFGVGVVLHGTDGGQVLLEGNPDENGTGGTQIAINGTGGSGYAGTGTFVGNYVPNDGVILADNVSITTPWDVSITGHGGTNSNGVVMANLTGDPTLDADPVSGTINAYQITITSTAGNVLLNEGLTASNGITITSPGTLVLDDVGGSYITTGNLAVNTTGAILINTSISGDGTDSIAATNGNITLGSDASLSDTGEGNVLSLAAGTSLPHSHYVINDASLGADAVTVSNDASFAIFQADSASNTADNIDFTATYSQYGATYPGTGLPTGNGLLYFVGSADAVGPNSPNAPPPSSTPTNLLDLASEEDGSGSNLVPVSTVPQNGDVQISGGDLPGSGGTPGNPALNFGNNPGGPGSSNGGLASSSGNGGLIGPNDSGVLGGGALGNFQNPAVYSAFGTALGPAVYNDLSAALGADFYPSDSQPGSGGPGDGGSNEMNITPGGVVVIQDGKIKTVPAGQVPNQLNNALNKSTLNNLPGH